MSRPRMSPGPAVAIHGSGPAMIPQEEVVLYRWHCRLCKLGGTLPCTRSDSAAMTIERAKAGHARKSPNCKWSEDDVTLCRTTM